MTPIRSTFLEPWNARICGKHAYITFMFVFREAKSVLELFVVRSCHFCNLGELTATKAFPINGTEIVAGSKLILLML